jgi:hypothetical protein
MGEHGVDSSDSRWVQVVGFCEHSNEPLCSVKCRDSLD